MIPKWLPPLDREHPSPTNLEIVYTKEDVRYLFEKFPSMDDALRIQLQYYIDAKYDGFETPWMEIIENKTDESYDIIDAMIDRRGETFLMENTSDECGILLKAIEFHAPFELVNKIIDIGNGTPILTKTGPIPVFLHLIEESDFYSKEHFHAFIAKMVDLCGYPILFDDTCNNNSPISEMVTKFADDVETLNFLLSIMKQGGDDIFRGQDKNGLCSVLHHACNEDDISLDIIDTILKEGGKEIVLLTDEFGFTALMNDNCNSDVIHRLLDIGGKDLVLIQDSMGVSVLQYTPLLIIHSLNVFQRMLHLGGKDLVMLRDHGGCLPLHEYCKNVHFENGAREFMIDEVIKIGGQEQMYIEDKLGQTALHHECYKKTSCFNIVKKFIQFDPLLLMKTNHNGLIPLHEFIIAEKDIYEAPLAELIVREKNIHEVENKIVLTYLLHIGIECEIGGDLGIGGLFTSTNERVKNSINKTWDRVILPCLEEDMRKILPSQPVLHAAIVANASADVIRSITKKLKYCLRDSLGRLAINIAAEHSMEWDNGMKEIAESTQIGPENELDEGTGLYPFMLAATGMESDFNTIYELTRRCPQLVKFAMH